MTAITLAQADRLIDAVLARGSFEGRQEIARIGRRLRVMQQCDAGDAGRHLLQQFDPLSGNRS